jgi:hypothetical protein
LEPRSRDKDADRPGSTDNKNSGRVLVIGPYLRARRGEDGAQPGMSDARDFEARLDEAAGLARAIDLVVAETVLAPIGQIRPATYLGKGKVDEILGLIAGHDIELVVMDCALGPIQQRNLEKAWSTKVLDRTGLILEIFGRRAKTREGALQVELAHLNYQRSRLVRSWTHLERQRGGFGFMGGPGETQIEADRRLIGERISRLENELKKVQATRRLHRAGRQRVPYRVVALVGYTNAGKSTLFNRLTRADVQAADMLCRRSWSQRFARRSRKCSKPTSFSTSATSPMKTPRRSSAMSIRCCGSSASIPMAASAFWRSGTRSTASIGSSARICKISPPGARRSVPAFWYRPKPGRGSTRCSPRLRIGLRPPG